jgi:hypothetical protein
VFRDFMERVDIVWAPLVRGAGIDARTTQIPAHREASPKCFTGWPCPPAGTHSNASFAADAFAEDRKIASKAGFPCRQDLLCPVFRPAVLDVIAGRERPRLAHHTQNRLIEEFLAVENGRYDIEMH